MKKRMMAILLALALMLSCLLVGCGSVVSPILEAGNQKAKLATDQSNARALKSIVTTKYLSYDGVNGTPRVYYLNSDANDILTSTAGAMKCEGNGEHYGEYYSNSPNGGDAGYIWVYWNGSAVTDTNPSLK